MIFSSKLILIIILILKINISYLNVCFIILIIINVKINITLTKINVWLWYCMVPIYHKYIQVRLTSVLYKAFDLTLNMTIQYTIIMYTYGIDWTLGLRAYSYNGVFSTKCFN